MNNITYLCFNIFFLFAFSVLNNIFYFLPMKVKVIILFTKFSLSTPHSPKLVTYSFWMIHDWYNSYGPGRLSWSFNIFRRDYICFFSAYSTSFDGSVTGGLCIRSAVTEGERETVVLHCRSVPLIFPFSYILRKDTGANVSLSV